MEARDRIFISYSRSDGWELAEAFERRLEDETDIRSWRDLRSMDSGNVRQQVLRAIEQAEHLVLILSPGALRSEWVTREWTHARERGRKVSPVLADPALTRDELPGWMRRGQIYDMAEAEQWTLLKRVLAGPGLERPVLYMAGDLTEDFVPRPVEYQRVKEAVLAAGSDRTVALTTALRGAGGYGKTTLANFLCRDPDVRAEFTDGILRMEIGKERADITPLIAGLIQTLEPQGGSPVAPDVETAAEHLARALGEARLLLVIDDVWREAQLRPFLRGGPNCARLVTTRLPHVLPARHVPIVIDAMEDAAALRLISANLPEADAPGTRVRLAALADRLGNWAQMLGIANGWLHERMSQGEGLAAIDRFERRLARRGLTGFDPRDETQRNRAIRLCVETSLEDLAADELARFGELAILPEDEDVPLAVIEALWQETGGWDAEATDEFVGRLYRRSLLQQLDRGAAMLRLHDNMVWYLGGRIGTEGCRAAHASMVRALHIACHGQWEKLPVEHTYGWRFLIPHLRGAGQDAEADRLLTEYAWIKAKLWATGAHNLFRSYVPESSDEAARLLGRAIALSLPALADNPRELARQLYERLAGNTQPVVAAIGAAARLDQDFRPAPRWSGLAPPGAERLRLIGHQRPVISACFSPTDGARIATASQDNTARVWDTTFGHELASLRGHEASVESVCFSPSGTHVLTASIDGTARLWDANTGQELALLRGHRRELRSACFSPSGARIVTASTDRTARLWDTNTGQEVAVLRGHKRELQGACFSPDETRILTASADRTARLWNAASGQQLAALRGHEGPVTSARFSSNRVSDDVRIVTASIDGTARIWDSTGQQRAILRSGKEGLQGAYFSPDGARVVTTSVTGIVQLWDPTTELQVTALRSNPVLGVSFSPDSTRLVTASTDFTARLWDATSGKELAVIGRHEARVFCARFSPDGTRIVTASADRTARLWDLTARKQLSPQHGHQGPVASVRFLSDGVRIVTTSTDRTVRTWEAATGQELAVLGGHEGLVMDTWFSSDTVRIVTALTTPTDSTAQIWDATSRRRLLVLQGHQRPVLSACFSLGGNRVVTTSDDGTARIWDATTGRELLVLHGHQLPVLSASFVLDGNKIVTASADGTARIWDAATGRQLAVLCGHEDALMGASFSPDGARIVTASKDRTARIWDATTARGITVVRHNHWVNSACFSPNGARIVTASFDRTARIWDTGDGREIARIALDGAVKGLDVRDGAIALGDALGHVHVFDAAEFLQAECSSGG
jgi:WD40 repeat protein